MLFPLLGRLIKQTAVVGKATLYNLIEIYQVSVELSSLEERGSKSLEIFVTLYQTTLRHIQKTVYIVIAVGIPILTKITNDGIGVCYKHWKIKNSCKILVRI